MAAVGLAQEAQAESEVLLVDILLGFPKLILVAC